MTRSWVTSSGQTNGLGFILSDSIVPTIIEQLERLTNLGAKKLKFVPLVCPVAHPFNELEEAGGMVGPIALAFEGGVKHLARTRQGKTHDGENHNYGFIPESLATLGKSANTVCTWLYSPAKSLFSVFQTISKSTLKYPCATALRIW